jgi:hypothetical protein
MVIASRLRRLAVAAAMVASASCSDPVSPEDFYGVWGAEGVRLTLSNTLARFETSCWAGDLAIPIQINGEEFHAIGNVNWQGGAGGTETRAVILIGRLNDDALRLTVESSMSLGPYNLRKDQVVNIPGCP